MEQINSDVDSSVRIRACEKPVRSRVPRRPGGRGALRWTGLCQAGLLIGGRCGGPAASAALGLGVPRFERGLRSGIPFEQGPDL
nr:hypothetical protein GCM10025732_14930 [Glycomyces mayteni]